MFRAKNNKQYGRWLTGDEKQKGETEKGKWVTLRWSPGLGKRCLCARSCVSILLSAANNIYKEAAVPLAAAIVANYILVLLGTHTNTRRQHMRKRTHGMRGAAVDHKIPQQRGTQPPRTGTNIEFKSGFRYLWHLLLTMLRIYSDIVAVR